MVPTKSKGFSETHWNQGWKRPITLGHLVHPLTPDTAGFSTLYSPKSFVLATLKWLKSWGFHPCSSPTGRPVLSSTHIHLQIFSWEHIQIFLHFISSCDPHPENPSASSIGMNTECVHTYMWTPVYGFITPLTIKELGAAKGHWWNSFPTRSSEWELTTVTKPVASRKKGSLELVFMWAEWSPKESRQKGPPFYSPFYPAKPYHQKGHKTQELEVTALQWWHDAVFEQSEFNPWLSYILPAWL